ncbi:MAG: hypothetical protein KDB77_01005, partial [Flavobacteriales bacterium]|nr:hypothetical protein [Flavobacteriales bacterium]
MAPRSSPFPGQTSDPCDKLASLSVRSVDIILPLRVAGSFSYDVPPELGVVQVGMRVVVPFGKGRRLYT